MESILSPLQDLADGQACIHPCWGKQRRTEKKVARSSVSGCEISSEIQVKTKVNELSKSSVISIMSCISTGKEWSEEGESRVTLLWPP